jgi:hypothetical protein
MRPAETTPSRVSRRRVVRRVVGASLVIALALIGAFGVLAPMVVAVVRDVGAMSGVTAAAADSVPHASGFHELAVSAAGAGVVVAAGLVVAWRAERRDRALRG